MSMKIGFYQFSSSSLMKENIDNLLFCLNEVTNAILVLPELFLMDCSEIVYVKSSEIETSLGPLLSLSKKNNLSLIGSSAILDKKIPFNQLLYINSGEIVGKCNKKNV